MTNPLNPIKAAYSVAREVAKPIESMVDLSKGTRPQKGKLISVPSLHGQKFFQLIKNLVTPNDLIEIGCKTIDDLVFILKKAHERLGTQNKITVDNWLGDFFQIIGATIPEVKFIEKLAIEALIAIANEYVVERKSGFSFMNGYYEMAGVKKTFKGTEVINIHNVWIKQPGQPKGRLYVDKAVLIPNADGQMLFNSSEFKTRGSSSELKWQITQRDERIFDMNNKEGTKITYNVEGKTGFYETDFENLILLRDSKNPTIAPVLVDLFSRIGIRAGKRYNAFEAIDDKGRPYIRIIVPIETDKWRRIIYQLLRDKSWQ